MDAHLNEWLHLLIRWFHIVAGIMWIGTSMFFMWLDSAFVPLSEPRQGVLGELWMVHGGSFYHVERRHLGPGEIPDRLHWFKWESGLTWISGFLLLTVVYYLGDRALLVDPEVSSISHTAAVHLGIGLLIGSWLVYDTLWRSPLGRLGLLPVVISCLLVVAVAYALTHVLSPRAAYMHVGAMLGTIMTANVFLRIMPAQSAMFAATLAGKLADLKLGEQAKLRSRHNNYMTMPVIFVMMSNHFPTTYGNHLNWLILAALFLGSAIVNHFHNIGEHFRGALPAALAVIVLTLVPLYFLTSPPRAENAGGDRVSFGQARAVIVQRCTACHSLSPTDPAFPAPPAGVTFDTPEQIRSRADRIRNRVVETKTMPLGNKTGMTPAERELLGRWIAQGAQLK